MTKTKAKKLPLFEKEQRKVNSLIVMCGYYCQLSCSYCGVKKTQKVISFEIFTKALYFLCTTKSKEIQLRFFGGEPLIEWDFLKKAIPYATEYAKSKGKLIKFMITTNGILLKQAQLDFLRDWPVEIMFSFDGDIATNFKQRFNFQAKNVLQNTLTNLKRLVVDQIPYFVNVVVIPENVNSLFDNLSFLRKQAVKKIQLCYQCGCFWEFAAEEEFFSQLRRFLEKHPQKDFIMNFTNDCEPTILSQEILVDCDGVFYFDAAIMLEKKFPWLRKAYQQGGIKKFISIDELYCDKRELYQSFSKNCNREEKKILDNNIEFGLEFDSFLKRYPLQSIKSNEHPLFIPLIHEDFLAQRDFLNKLAIGAVYLYLESSCLNDCVFCMKKTVDRVPDFYKIKRKLERNTSLKIDKLCIIGNEPLSYPEVCEVVYCAKKSGFNQVEIMTSGELLENKSFAKELVKNGMTSVSLPLFSFKAIEHDCIVGRKGSFVQIQKAIDNLVSLGVGVFIHSNLMRQNLNSLIELEKYVVHQLKLPFVILPLRPKSSNLPFSELMPSYSQIKSELKGINSLMGFPLCVVRRIQKDLLKSADFLSDAMKLYMLDQKFSKLAVCRKCRYNRKCMGIFREYAQIYSLSDIKPIIKEV